MTGEYVTTLQWIDRQQRRMGELLASWARINSGSYHVGGVAEQLHAVWPLLEEAGAEVEMRALPGREVIGDGGAVEIRPLGEVMMGRSPGRRAGPRVLLGIHVDTVYGADSAFQEVTRVDGNTLRGPGVCDAKGGLIVMLFALLALERSAFASGLNWEVVLNPDEELGSPGSGKLFEAAARRNDLGLLFEPALPDGALVSSRKGSGNFTFVVHGKSAHAGRNSAEGRNAIHALAALISRVAGWQREIGGTVVNTGYIHGGGAVNVVPDRAMCRVNIRVETSRQQGAIEERVLGLMEREGWPEGIALEVHGGFHCPPKPLTPRVEWMLGQLAECGRMIEVPVAWRATGGACDGNRLAAAGLPVIDSLGVRGGNIHTDQEFVQLDSLAERAKLTALFLMRLASGEIAMDDIRQSAEGVT